MSGVERKEEQGLDGVPPRIFIRRLSAALGGIRRNGFYYVIQKMLSCVLYSLWIYFVNTFGQSCGHPTLGDSSARRLRSYGGVQRFTDTRRPFGGVDGLSGVDRACVHITIYDVPPRSNRGSCVAWRRWGLAQHGYGS